MAYVDFKGVTFFCPTLDREVTTTDVSIVGGGRGHCGEQDYCYCDSTHLEVGCECGGKKKMTHYLYV